ncbi:DnaT-like ssDNA-binding protein [Sneathiella glossodoripedis]|uniref:DnaT-like ssDNA-binding protein n=1 Tax=Sneathiella glossodoripedis TaxID=418853 RepID=UPI000688EA85|nr:DnaT-like ssDNA-binding protein [Sneathiella glossodoripedis]
MGLIVETGEGIEGANSYLSLSQADAHFAALGNEEWAAASDGLREQALIRASQQADFYDYPGTVLKIVQGLKWPRSGAVDDEGRQLRGLPFALKAAVLELAPGFLQIPAPTTDGPQIVREKVGMLELVYSDRKATPALPHDY